jgi:4-hydroxy-3-methylbut-2-en-1-yl diphosphate reductase
MEIIIDKKSGFCFGVSRAIEMAEKEVLKDKRLYCLGEIVHNSEEVARLEQKGIQFIDRQTFFTLTDCRVLFRAHGEPPETYEYAKKHDIEIIDATCPVVLKLQDRVKNARELNPDAQIVIYGKALHPEVIALRGQIDRSIIIQSEEDLSKIDFSVPVFLFAQTTMDRQKYAAIREKIASGIREAGRDDQNLTVFDSICGQVANRAPWLAEFSRTVDTLIFVGGKNSSNSKVLFDICKKNNPSSYFLTRAEELDALNLHPVEKIGITGATSTPLWLIEKVSDRISSRFRL